MCMIYCTHRHSFKGCTRCTEWCPWLCRDQGNELWLQHDTKQYSLWEMTPLSLSEAAVCFKLNKSKRGKGLADISGICGCACARLSCRVDVWKGGEGVNKFKCKVIWCENRLALFLHAKQRLTQSLCFSFPPFFPPACSMARGVETTNFLRSNSGGCTVPYRRRQNKAKINRISSWKIVMDF